MNKAHCDFRTSHAHTKKFDGQCIKGHCEDCGKEIPVCQAYSYVDESNGAISANAPGLCAECYEKRYGKKVLTAEEATRQDIAENLERLAAQIHSCHDATLVHRIAAYVREAKPDD